MSKKILFSSISTVIILIVIGILSCAPVAKEKAVRSVQKEEEVIVAGTPEEVEKALQEREAEEAPEKIKIGVIQITLEHEYQVMLNKGFIDKAEEMGAEVILCVHEMNPENCVTCGEDLIAAGVKAIICAPGDPASWQAVLAMCRDAGIPLLNDGSPQPLEEGVVPFIGTDSRGGGNFAGEFAGNWINENLGGSAKVLGLTLPTFTDCVARNEGFNEALYATATGEITLIEENGHGLREKGLEVGENVLQAHPDLDVIFGCNDDSALGAMSAAQAAGKDPEKFLVIGFDGTLGAFEEIKKGGMMRCDIVQQPYLYAQMHMERAIKIARGEATIEEYQEIGALYIQTPVVIMENVDEWIEKVSAIMPK